ncbi:hypothetical protein MKW92_048414, partial [Papaver armeniacum]
METHFLSSLVKKSKIMICGMWLWREGSLYFRQVKRRTRRSVVCEAASAKKAKNTKIEFMAPRL